MNIIVDYLYLRKKYLAIVGLIIGSLYFRIDKDKDKIGNDFNKFKSYQQDYGGKKINLFNIVINVVINIKLIIKFYL